MLRYMAREQSRTIDRLENRKKNIDLVTAKTIATRKELNTIERDEQKNRDQLELDKSRRQVALEKLKKEISTHKERYGNSSRMTVSSQTSSPRLIVASHKPNKLNDADRRRNLRKPKVGSNRRRPTLNPILAAQLSHLLTAASGNCAASS